MKTPFASLRRSAPATLCRLLSLSSLIALSGCATHISLKTPPPGECLTLLPEAVRKPTPGAARPQGWTVGTLASFADAQTGQLDKANADKAEIFAFDARCKARDAALVASLTKRRKFLGIF